MLKMRGWTHLKRLQKINLLFKCSPKQEDDVSAKYGAGVSAFKNQDIETAKSYLVIISILEMSFITTGPL